MSTFPAPVPKPAAAGSGQPAIAKTRAAFVNLRNGPSTNHRDIGDIRNNTTVTYYPATRTTDGWVFLEQGTLSGWVSTSVLTFENVPGTPPIDPTQPTPYAGQFAVWHWKGDVLPENTIDEVARNLKAVAPNVTQLWVKICDATASAGAQWQGYWDTKRSLAIDGPQSIDRWVQVLNQHGIQFHAWCVPKGTHVEAETNIMIEACRRPGVRSLILDVEPYANFWQGGREGVRPFMTRLRRALPGSFHIGMTVDPRRHHFAGIFPQEWFPFVNSIHPQVYWATFRQEPGAALQEAFEVWGSYGRPIIPALQGDALPSDMSSSVSIAAQRHRATGVSWWRLGVISPQGWTAIRTASLSGATNPPPPDDVVTEEVVIRPDDPGFSSGTYTGQEEFQRFTNTWGWTTLYKATEPQSSKVWARWTPTIRRTGRYEVAAFVPGRHSNSANARYRVTNMRGSVRDILVNIDQSRYVNAWVTLGIFELDPTQQGAGTVFLNDLTGETGRSIAFDAIRYRFLVPETPSVDPENTADGFDSPVGTLAERQSDKVWPGQWIDASPFARLYFIGTPREAYHTGADLNLPRDADRSADICAAANGVVTFASRLPVWGNVIIIRHHPLATDKKVYYTRYGHVEAMQVKVGDRVKRGDLIAKVGNAFGTLAYHLHFDISPTAVWERSPQDWPGRDLNRLLANYVDPKEFILKNRPKS